MKCIKKWWKKQSISDKVSLIATIVMVTYVVACIVNVITHNNLPNDYKYPIWNIFSMFQK